MADSKPAWVSHRSDITDGAINKFARKFWNLADDYQKKVQATCKPKDMENCGHLTLKASYHRARNATQLASQEARDEAVMTENGL